MFIPRFLFARSDFASSGGAAVSRALVEAADSADGAPVCAADQVLAERLRTGNGDAAVIAELIDAHYATLLRYATTFVDPDAATDVVQDVFVSMWERRHALVLRRSFISYLMRAVRNMALNHIRYERAEQHRASRGDEIASVSQPDAILEDGERAALIRDAVAALSPRYREVMALRVLGLGYGEIAEVLSLSPKTVQTRGLRGLAILRERLAGRF